jgi:ubiquinone/menaquinone biosynthesis C-methylase UbiE
MDYIQNQRSNKMNKDKIDSYSIKLLNQINHFSKTDKLMICQKMLDLCLKEILTHEQTSEREQIQKQVIKRVIDKRVHSLLDFGCNTGRLTNFLSQFAEEIYGADIEGWYGLEMKKNCPEAKYILIKHSKLPIKENFFDIVVSCKVLQHFNSKAIMDMGYEIKRVLKKNGKLILYEGIKSNDQEGYNILPLKRISFEVVKEIDDNYGLIIFKK